MPESERKVAIPPHGSEVVPWVQSERRGTVEDRTLREVTVRIPPRIADIRLAVPSELAVRAETAQHEIASLDAVHGSHLRPLATLLLRNESVASSKIEHVEATVEDYARALHGIRSNSSAASMVASTEALRYLIESVDGGHALTVENIHRAHRVLMADDPYEKSYAGRFRDMQNWIGGSDYSPRGALFVPPPPESIDASMTDLLRFAARDDLSSIAQSAVLHAQFESIHPYTDGNGRIGRALVNTVLRRRGVTRRVVVPLASALVARRDDYFAMLGAYRDGDAGPVVAGFAEAARISAAEARVSAARIAAMPGHWHEAAGRPRGGSATQALLGVLADHPILSSDDALDLVGGARSSVFGGIARLHDAGVLRPLTDRVRNQIWGASDLLDELADLSTRIGARAHEAL